MCFDVFCIVDVDIVLFVGGICFGGVEVFGCNYWYVWGIELFWKVSCYVIVVFFDIGVDLFYLVVVCFFGYIVV